MKKKYLHLTKLFFLTALLVETNISFGAECLQDCKHDVSVLTFSIHANANSSFPTQSEKRPKLFVDESDIRTNANEDKWLNDSLSVRKKSSSTSLYEFNFTNDDYFISN